MRVGPPRKETRIMPQNPDKNSHGAVVRPMARHVNGRKPPISQNIGRDIVAKCRDGKWYPLKKIAHAVGATEVDTRSVVERMCWPSRTSYGVRAERKKIGN